jgi:hypothetical protein
MNASRITVIVIILLAVAVLILQRSYLTEEGAERKLATVDCAGLLPTVFELQGRTIPVTREQTCEIARMISTMKPTGEEFGDTIGDPWHYFGRMRILPRDDAWFIVFLARRSNGFTPRFSLRHRRSRGWFIAGQFDAAPLLAKLGVTYDRALLESDSALEPTDQNQTMGEGAEVE